MIHTTQPRPNLYRCFYNGKRMDVPAETPYHAQEHAAKQWRTKGFKVATSLIGKGYDATTGTVAELVGVDRLA